MSGKVFISYRRDDSSAWAGRLYDRLFQHFSQNEIFMDVDTIEPGVDFVEAIEEVIGACDVLIAVIGSRWLTSSDRGGRRRLDIPEDIVRLEIATALKRGIRVVPVLVDGATMPEVGELPDDLKALVRRNAVEIGHNRFNADSERLVTALERALGKATEQRERLDREQRERAATEIRERQEKEQLDARRREHEELERLEADRLEKERLETQQREKDRVEAEQRERERLVAERRQREEKERLEHEPQAQPPSPVAPVAPSPPPAKSEAANPSAETQKVVYPLPPKPAEPEREKPSPSSSGGTGGKSRSKQVIAFLAIAAVLVVAGLIYLANRASKSQPPQPAPIAAMTPSPPIIAAPTVEEKAPPTPGVAVQPTAPVAVVNPSLSLKPTAVAQPTLSPTAPVAVVTPKPAIIVTPSAEERQRVIKKDAAGLLVPEFTQKKLNAVAVTVGDLGNPFFVQIAHGAQAQAKKYNAAVKFTAESSNYDVNNQTNQMDNFVSSGVNLILLHAADSKDIAPAVVRAKAAGIIVVAVDVAAEGGVDATVTSNNKQAGELDGKYVADRLKGKGRVVIVNGPPVPAVTERVAGFLDVIKKYPNIKMLSQDQNARGSRDGGLRVMTDLLTAFNKIDAVFAINDPSAIGCDLAAKQAQRNNFFIVGVDGAPDVVPSLKDPNSLIAASAAQDPYAMAEKAVEIGYNIINGQKPEQALILIPVELITKENVDQYKGWTK
jgi:ribose transport system substrate-binding protein